MAVESELFPYLRVTFTVRERTEIVEALIDTGFDGDLVVPRELITNGQPPDSFQAWVLADGSRVRTGVYAGTVQIGSLPPLPADIVALGEEPLVGRGVTDRYRLILDHGQRVILEP